VVDIPNAGRSYRLKKEAVKLLEDDCLDVLSKLPGYEPPPPPKKRRSFWLFDENGPQGKHSDKIHVLLDKTVFEAFVFVRVAT
jgi:hypothetical protein